MYIEQLTLKSYRNYEQANITFNNKINVIIGENAQGKTNLLEAIYVLAFTQSYRTSRDQELIKWDKDFAKVSAIINKKNSNIPIELIIYKGGKKVKLNDLEQRKLSEYVGNLNIVMFAPEDLTLIKGPPNIRRRFIDMELGQIQPIYLYHLGQYQKVLKQRNHLLKSIRKNKATDRTFLQILTEKLISHAVIILKKRFSFIKMLRKWAIPLHLKLSRKLETLEILYDSSIDVLEDDKEEKIEEKYFQRFKEIEQNEIDRGMTLIGPHRDDLSFYINGQNVKIFGSQGQQRTTALSIKLAEIELIYHEIDEYPILLLDDVLSELDDERQTHLLNSIQGKVQTFVSTTNIDGIDHATIQEADIFTVKNGNIKKEQ